MRKSKLKEETKTGKYEKMRLAKQNQGWHSEWKIFHGVELWAVTRGLSIIPVCRDTVAACIPWATMSLWQGQAQDDLVNLFYF